MAAVRLDPAAPDPAVDRRYLCCACLPLARAVSLPERAPAPLVDEGASADASTTPEANRWPAPADVPAPLAHDTGRPRTGVGVGQHILSLRQVFSREAMVAGVTREGHCGIELTRGSTTVRCRACGQDVARAAEIAGGAPWADPHYEYTPAGLDTCPATQSVGG